MAFTRGNKKFGAVHIMLKHYQTERGKVTGGDILDIGDIIRRSEPYIGRDGNRVYEQTKFGITHRVVIGDDPKGEKVISYFTLDEEGKKK